MVGRKIDWAFAGLCLAILCTAGLVAPRILLADSSPATQPTTQPTTPAKTGAFDITFTQRSPNSDPKELARRLNLKPGDVAKDYDLSKCPYKIYVPTNYDPATPCGIFVYLGYKDSVSTPPLWNSALDQAHLIFITPVCHTGTHYPNSVPLWQSVGLAMDAIYNLKEQYAIDDHRIYMMSITEGNPPAAFALADTCTGFILGEDSGYFRPVPAAQINRFWAPKFAPPPSDLLSQAHSRAFFMIDNGDAATVQELKPIVFAMKQDEFQHVTRATVDLMLDLHYPNFTVPWLQEKALPFLDSASAPSPAGASTTNPTNDASEPSPAQQMLSMAQLYIANGQTDLAKTKLQEVIDTYPGDPAADKAKSLLQQLNNQ
jgi:hypothetical protein